MLQTKVYDTSDAGAMPDMVEVARRYAAAGFAVFPLEPNGKAPSCSHGFKDATTDELRIRRLFRRADNIGVACGQASGGLVVIDCDTHETDGVAAFDALLAEHPATELLTAHTPSGGVHAYFRTPLSRLFKTVARRIGIDGCDLRSDGGYIVLPPSRIAGAEYRFDEYDAAGFAADEVPVMPEWLGRHILAAQWGEAAATEALAAIERGEAVDDVAEQLKRAGAPASRMTVLIDGKPMSASTSRAKNVSRETSADGTVSAGSRNDSLFRLACSLRSTGLRDENALLDMLEAFNSTHVNPPLGASELLQIVRSALRYAPYDDTPAATLTEPMTTVTTSAGDAVEVEVSCLPSTSTVNGVAGLAVRRTKRRVIVEPTVSNITRIITHDVRLAGRIVWDEFAQSTMVRGRLPWMSSSDFREWSNADDASLEMFLQDVYGMGNVNPGKLAGAILAASHQQSVNPLVDHLQKLSWDGKPRAETLLVACLGADDTPFTREVTRLFLRGAYHRAKTPGCKFDFVLMLKGAQGIGKSWIVRKLAMRERYLNDNLATIDGDRALEKIRGCWFVELAELLATKKTREVEAIKAFTTSMVDYYRAPYARLSERHPRTCVFVGTTNAEAFLADRTGNRRFLVVECGKHAPTVDMWSDAFDAYIEQVWAEIVATDDDAPLTLSDAAIATRDEINLGETEDDPRIGMVEAYLEHIDHDRVCIIELLEKALELPAATIEQKRSLLIQDMSRIMATMPGWHKGAGRRPCGDYGRQRYYERDDATTATDDALTDESPF